MRPLSLFVVFLAIPVIAQSVSTSPALGHIVGKVVNQAGEPVAKARLCWGHYDERGGASTCGNEADDEGRFNLRVALDTNRVWAEKPSDGYLSDSDFSKLGQSISITPQKPTAHLVVKLGARPGHITFNVVDKNSGLPIKGFEILVAVVDEHSILTRFEVRDQPLVAIPPDNDLLILVQANGYRRWFYMDGATAGQPTVRLESGEERNVEADLEPKSAHN
jgi:hypothetical protein